MKITTRVYNSIIKDHNEFCQSRTKGDWILERKLLSEHISTFYTVYFLSLLIKKNYLMMYGNICEVKNWAFCRAYQAEFPINPEKDKAVITGYLYSQLLCTIFKNC